MAESETHHDPTEIADGIPPKKLEIIKAVKQASDETATTKTIREVTGYSAKESEYFRSQSVAEGLLRDCGLSEGHNIGREYALTERGAEVITEAGQSDTPTFADVLNRAKNTEELVDELGGNVDDLETAVRVQGKKIEKLEKRAQFWKESIEVLAKNEDYFDVGEINQRVSDKLDEE